MGVVRAGFTHGCGQGWVHTWVWSGLGSHVFYFRLTDLVKQKMIRRLPLKRKGKRVEMMHIE